MMLGVAIHEFEGGQALEVVAGGIFHCQAHAAMQLNRALPHFACGLGYRDLCRGDISAARLGVSVVSARSRRIAIERARSAAIVMSTIRCCST